MEYTSVRLAFADRYAIEEELGSGGAATVYAAEDLKHGRRVAVKVLRPEFSALLGAERFLREIRIVAGLSHPHILPLHDSGEAGGFLYYVMPLVEGASLRERLAREGPLPSAEAVRIVCDVAEALDCAHRHGVVHRDVKPENILFREGHAAVADFGVARARTGEPERTDPGFVVGTPEYICPEAWDGSEVDARADQYSLACVLYEMLAGRPPFTAATPQAVALRHMADVVPPLAALRPDVPPGIVRAVERALGKSPAARFPTTLDFAEALREAADGAGAGGGRSVAVLPFANVGGLPEDEPLADGISDEILQALTRLEGLRVASRTSAHALRGRRLDARAIATELHVGAVLEGSVQRSGGRLRVTVQLVNARDGYLLWSDRYDRAMADVFAIQDEVAQNVARALRVILDTDAVRPLAPPPTRDVRAYEYYLRGRQYFRQTRKKSLQFAREMFQRAIALDDTFARAWAGVADCCSLLHMYYPQSGADLGLADDASAKALALAPDDAAAHTARAFALWRLQRAEEASAEFDEALRRDASSFDAHYFRARMLFGLGRTAEAAAHFEAAARVQEDYQARFFAAQSRAALGEAAEAEAAYRRALHAAEQHLELNPDDPRAATMCAVSLCRLGRKDEGLAWAARAVAIDPEDPGVIYNVACLYALEGQTERALDFLEQALKAGFGGRDWVEHDPDLDALRDHPRFRQLAWQ